MDLVIKALKKVSKKHWRKVLMNEAEIMKIKEAIKAATSLADLKRRIRELDGEDSDG